MATDRVTVTELDPEKIKSDITEFFKNDPDFADYDFTEPGLDTLMNILTGNTYRDGFYVSQVANEAFLGTASRRNSVVSKAKELNYTPRSTQGSIAEITLTVNSPEGSPASILVPKNTQFSSEVDGTTYTFINDNSITIVPNNGIYSSNIIINEGVPETQQYTVDTTNEIQRFLLTKSGADTGSLVVSVQNSATDPEIFVYSLASDITELFSTTRAYYLQEVEDDKYEVIFGDGTLSAAVTDGNIVYLSYRNSVGTASDGAKTFNLISAGVGDSFQFTDITLTTTSVAAGGANKESIDSIKFNAPKHFETQNRAVTINDYVRLIKRDFGNIRSIAAWGGEDNIPKTFGRVYVAINPRTGFVLTDIEKTQITSSIKTQNVVAITPTIIDPDFTFIVINGQVTYDPRATSKDSGTLISNIRTTIDQYNLTRLEDFGDQFRHSELTQLVDNTDISILNNTLRIRIRKTITPSLTDSSSYIIDYRNSIYNPNDEFIGAVSSTTFTLADISGDCQFEDLDGVLRIVQYSNGARTIIVSNAGTVNYTTGVVTISDFLPATISGTVISITAIPNSEDIVSFREQLLRIDQSDVNIRMIEDVSRVR